MTGYSTAQRKLLLAFLGAHPDAKFTARQIADALSGESISLSAVYRNVAALEQSGEVRRSAGTDSKEALYQYIGHCSCRDSIHFTCVDCGKIFHLHDAAAKEISAAVTKGEGFVIDMGKTVLYGKCNHCK